MMSTWQNRITRYGEEAPDQLLANPKNWRTHPGSQTDALAGVLREVGIVQNVLVNERSGYVIDGHARIALALREGQPTIPVTYVDLSEAEEAEILVTLDPLAAMAGTDAVQLEALLAEVSSGEAGVQAMLAELAERAGLVDQEPQTPESLWEGMPEFEQEDKEAYQSIHIHFKTKDDVEEFARLVNQTITERTRYLWFPYIEIERYADKRYADES